MLLFSIDFIIYKYYSFYINIPSFNLFSKMEVVSLPSHTPELIPEETLEKMVRLLKDVANPGRLQIMNILLNGECQVSEIQKTTGIKQSLASQILSNLKVDDVLKSRRVGNKVYYSFANNSIKKIMESIIAEI